MWAIGSAFSVVLLARLAPVSAQTAEAHCLPAFLNLTNTKGQDPCLVSSYVQGSCNNGQWDVPALDDGSHYVGPYKNEINECQCSSVVYDLVSACGLCQNKTIVAWSTWSLNCTADLKSPGAFNAPIPPGTSIPAWAYWNPETHGDLFSLAALVDTQGAAESTGAPAATNTRTGGSTTRSGSPTKSPTNTITAAADPGNSGGTNIGAIVGGVVGGILGVGLLGVLGIWLIRRNTTPTPPSAQYSNTQTSQPPGHPGLLSATTAGSPGFQQQGAPPQAWSPPPPSSYSGGGQYSQGYNAAAAPPGAYNGMGYAGAPASVYGATGTASTYSDSRAGSTQPFSPTAFSPYQATGSPAPGHFQASPTPRPGVYQGAAEL